MINEFSINKLTLNLFFCVEKNYDSILEKFLKDHNLYDETNLKILKDYCDNNYNFNNSSKFLIKKLYRNSKLKYIINDN